jgi:hypothetical protein
MSVKIKINDSKMFLAKLHILIYENSNTQIGLEIDKKCRDFIKTIEHCNYKLNNN